MVILQKIWIIIYLGFIEMIHLLSYAFKCSIFTMSSMKLFFLTHWVPGAGAIFAKLNSNFNFNFNLSWD